AFSVFIFNSRGELLLQRRAENKYHSGGLWSNTCCSHPCKDEEIGDTVKRRLKEEMGMECETEFKFKFIYQKHFENGLTEHELDHVYFGKSDDAPVPDPMEVQEWRYISLRQLQSEIHLHPESFSAWLQICLPEIMKLS
ncbi:MAG: isopentenyl-diphosphate Delta-isomerase, partial [Ginsengibacter sp.]